MLPWSKVLRQYATFRMVFISYTLKPSFIYQLNNKSWGGENAE